MGAVLLAIALVGCAAVPEPPSTAQGSDDAASRSPGSTERPTATTRPGHELYGFLPYWEMDDDGIAEHIAGTPLTTLALFSVTHTAKGAINTKQRGHALITGDIGRRLIREAHDRGVRVELVYTSFGGPRNQKLFESETLQATVVASLVAYAGEIGVDGINVDVETLDATLVPAYAGFVGDLRTALRAVDPAATVSVSTGAHALGAAMALAASTAGADRIFIMGYDYRTGRSDPGATAPIDRSDGGNASLRTSLELYAALGVPADRLLLGLPLYGIAWPVAGPVIGAPATGRGEAWFPRANVPLLTNPAIVPLRDEIEQVEVYFLASDGTVGPPSAEPPASPVGSAGTASASAGTASASAGAASPSGATAAASGSPSPELTWEAVYVDSPATLAPKLALANEWGLAGSGFWAIGYTRGLPEYTRLMERFAAGEPLP